MNGEQRIGPYENHTDNSLAEFEIRTGVDRESNPLKHHQPEVRDFASVWGGTPKRPRAPVQQACEQCRRGKRKCNGVLPCDTCQKYSRECSFAVLDKTDFPRTQPNQMKVISEGIRINNTETSTQKCVKCNSQLNINIDQERCDTCLRDSTTYVPVTSTQRGGRGTTPSRVPFYEKRDQSPGNSFEKAARGMVFTKWVSQQFNRPISFRERAWNLGIIGDQPKFVEFDIRTVLSQAHCEYFCLVFFERLYPIYCIFSRKSFMEKLALVYCGKSFDDEKSFVTVILGVVALGSFFSREDEIIPSIISRVALESLLIDKTKFILYEVSNISLPTSSQDSLQYLQGWMLYLLYLRATASPNALWMASSQALQYAELKCLPIEKKWQQGHEREISRRLFWCLSVFNYWISLELGKPRVQHTVVESSYPREKIDEYDCLSDYIRFYDVTKSSFASDSKVEDLLISIENLSVFKPRHQALILRRSYLAIVIFRRLYCHKYSVSEETASTFLDIATSGLQACRDFAKAGIPWWHVANLPFQSLFLLLVLDSNRSISLVDEALETLIEVSKKFCTKEMVETVRTAHTLIALIERRKAHDLSKFRTHLRTLQDFDDENKIGNGREKLLPRTRDDRERELFSSYLQFQDIDEVLSELLFPSE